MRAFLPLVLLFAACGNESGLKRVNQFPTARIDAPVGGEIFRQGAAPIVVDGTVGDPDGTFDQMRAEWTLDETEPVLATIDEDGTVHLTLDSAALTLGEHTISLHAEDKDADFADASVTFEVQGPLGPPVAEITAPVNGLAILPDIDITFTGVGSDTTTPADDLTFAWSSSIDGPLTGAVSGDGQSVLPSVSLSIGIHEITLSVTDLDGEVGTDTIVVNVEDNTPVPPEPGDLIFSEMMVNPSAPDEDGEWVELYNTSGHILDISGYSFHDDGSDNWVFDSSVLVEPHGYMVLCANVNTLRNGGVACDGWFFRNPHGEEPSSSLGHGSGIAIANNDDELVLTSPTGEDIDIFDYNDTSSDPIEANRSFGLDPDRLDGELNDDVGNWCVQTTLLPGLSDPGTPGAPNDPCF